MNAHGMHMYPYCCIGYDPEHDEKFMSSGIAPMSRFPKIWDFKTLD